MKLMSVCLSLWLLVACIQCVTCWHSENNVYHLMPHLLAMANWAKTQLEYQETWILGTTPLHNWNIRWEFIYAKRNMILSVSTFDRDFIALIQKKKTKIISQTHRRKANPFRKAIKKIHFLSLESCDRAANSNQYLIWRNSMHEISIIAFLPALNHFADFFLARNRLSRQTQNYTAIKWYVCIDSVSSFLYRTAPKRNLPSCNWNVIEIVYSVLESMFIS